MIHNKYLRYFLWAVVGVVSILVLVLGYMYVSSPGAIRQPKLEHAHFRLQFLVDGRAINFGEDEFQSQYNAKVCTDELSATPIHFHDHKDQFVHLHWKHLTGGLILKNYGLNRVGGPDTDLGYRFDKFPLQRVKIYRQVLPPVAKDTPFWVYVGDEHEYKQRSEADFLRPDIETFFSKKSTVNPTAGWLKNWFFAKALAHGVEEHGEQAKLEQINNLLGNVVIFVQKNEPTSAQIKERFDKLVPLSESSCGG